MQQNKNILIINDMPGYGKVALAAMLPILSHMGHNIYNLPTALVSNTLDYGKFTILDTTDYMKKSIAVWKELGFSFDCITTGFLASAEQVDIIRAFIESQRKEDLLVMTDPIMGDEGKLYNGVTEETVENMRHQAREVVDALLACGPRSVVITSGLEAETGRHVVWGYCHRQGRYFTLPFDFIQVHFPGTGDVFSAVLIGELLAGTGLEQAARKAMDTVERLVCLDRNEVEKNKGIRIERFLKELDL